MTSPEMNPLETEMTNLHASGNGKVSRRLNLDHDPRVIRRHTQRRALGSKITIDLDPETTG
jgi:hypothetical protein